MFKTVLIANRGAIACRVIRTLRKLGVTSIAIYHQADAESLHVREADIAVALGDGATSDTYLNSEKIIQIALEQGADAIHPGYGFLSENTDFVARCEIAGLVFIGPDATQMQIFGLKHEARLAAERAQVPLLPGSPLLTDPAEAMRWAEDVGYPVMLKSTAGGGGIGMQVCNSDADLNDAWESVKRLGKNNFSNDGVFLEKFVANARHIEVQVFGDGKGDAVALGERDCSAQRRNQKVIEETPAPGLSDGQRSSLCETACRLVTSVNYRNAGTVEFIFDADSGAFWFLEVNTRLQVEHGVTEEVWNVDLVEWMLQLAAGDMGTLPKNLKPQGHAIQARIYAEDPAKDFQPCAGLLSNVSFPSADNLRVETWLETGITVPALFDPMLAKVIVHADDRATALAILDQHLESTELYGIETNLSYLRCILQSDACQAGNLLTRSLAELSYAPVSITVVSGGTQTTVQDLPGRRGLWHVGVPPSGPMDARSFAVGNALLGNADDAAGLEITLHGPTLLFNTNARIALTGAEIKAELDGQPISGNEVVAVSAGQTLVLGKTGNGARSYLAVAGGIQCPKYLNSRATFTLGQFGGHNGRALRAGDVLHLTPDAVSSAQCAADPATAADLGSIHRLRVIYGPHGAPDFFTPKDIETFFASEWEVHFNSSRTGVRLIGPKPEWARESGGEAGLHPSNIHDNAYAFGTVDFTGDMPVILGPDGPSLGGFVCPATVINDDLWKLGQLRAGDKLKFIPVALEDHKPITKLGSPIVHTGELLGEDLVFRVAGDHFLLIELGEQALDIERRLKVHALMLWLEDHRLPGMQELTPGIRSLQIHYQPSQIALSQLIALVEQGSAQLASLDDLSVPARVVHLPLSWDDPACKLAIEKYQQSVRPDAPWCPSNLEFIQRINGLDSVESVKQTVFDASYLVMGLGDVYLGAPVATPLDPRHRLVTTKYNPARTWTAENSVGIGGAYLCIYGMEGPGGYQFVGRTLQMWNRYRRTEAFTQPWLLRGFDQIRFYPVSEHELTNIRADFPLGNYPIKIEETRFSLSEYQHFLADNDTSITAFESSRDAAFAKELQHWRDTGQLTYQAPDVTDDARDDASEQAPEGTSLVESPVSGTLWQQSAKEGQRVNAGDTLLILESMKMEIDVNAPHSGVVRKLCVAQGKPVSAGQALLWLEADQ